MKSIGFAVVSLLAVGILVLGLDSAREELIQVGAPPAPAVTLAQPASSAATAAPSAPPTRATRSPQSQVTESQAAQSAQARDTPEPSPSEVRAQEAVPPTPPRSCRRRRSRNRYPGPIPTPSDWEPPEGPVRIARRLPTVTRRMQNYYAFNLRRYEHSLHPMTIGVIIETGFLTSAGDRQIILSDPERAARGIVEASQ